MSLELKATVLEYELEDASGYKFKITANLDREFGWQAAVVISSHGLKTSEDAIRSLNIAAKHFSRMIEESIKEPPA